MSAYMKIDGPGIPGQAADSQHKNWIPVLSINQSIDRPLAHHAGLGGQSSVEFRDIMVTTKMGKHVPELAKAVASGTDFDEIQLDVCAHQGENQTSPYYVVKLKKVHISHFSIDNAAQGGEGDTITLGLHFDEIEWEFTQWHGKSKEGSTTTTWNVAQNKE